MQIELHSSNKFGPKEEVVVAPIDHNNPYDFRKLHRHSYFEFLLFEEGHGGKQIIDFLEYNISDKSLYLVIPGQVHLVKRLPKENGILIQFSKSFLVQSISPYRIDYFFQFLTMSEIKLSGEQFDNLYPLFKKLKTVYDNNTSLRSHKLVRLLGYILMEIFEIISQKTDLSQPNNAAYQFLNAVEKHFKTIKTVKEYAALLNIPMNKLNQKVKIHLGKSPLQIIHEMLLVEIKRLLVVEQLSHKEIAYQLDFDSQSSYSRFIKKQTTLSPSALKEQLSQIAQ